MGDDEHGIQIFASPLTHMNQWKPVSTSYPKSLKTNVLSSILFLDQDMSQGMTHLQFQYH